MYAPIFELRRRSTGLPVWSRSSWRFVGLLIVLFLSLVEEGPSVFGGSAWRGRRAGGSAGVAGGRGHAGGKGPERSEGAPAARRAARWVRERSRRCRRRSDDHTSTTGTPSFTGPALWPTACNVSRTRRDGQRIADNS